MYEKKSRSFHRKITYIILSRFELLLLRDRNHFFRDALYSPSYFLLIWWYISIIVMYPTSFRICCLEIHEKQCAQDSYENTFMASNICRSSRPEVFWHRYFPFFIEHLWWLFFYLWPILSNFHKIRIFQFYVFCKKGALNSFAKFRGNHLCQSLFFD